MPARIHNFYRERHRLTLERMHEVFRADVALMERLGLVRYDHPLRPVNLDESPLPLMDVHQRVSKDHYLRGPGGGNGAA